MASNLRSKRDATEGDSPARVVKKVKASAAGVKRRLLVHIEWLGEPGRPRAVCAISRLLCLDEAIAAASEAFAVHGAFNMIFDYNRNELRRADAQVIVTSSAWDELLGVLDEPHFLFQRATPIQRAALPAATPSTSVFVRTLTGKTITCPITLDEDITALKGVIEAKEGIPRGQARLIHDGRQLDDHRTLRQYGIAYNDIVLLVLKLRGDKPVILLYSPAPVDAKVELELCPAWHFSAIYPLRTSTTTKSGSSIVDWDVTVQTDGLLKLNDCNALTPYLFWEADADETAPHFLDLLFDPRQPQLIPSNAVAMPKAEVVPYLERTLTSLGLTISARVDMITYWLPSLNALRTPDVALRFLSPEEMASAADLRIEPNPDVVTRVFMLFKGVDASLDERWRGGDSVDWREVVGVDERTTDVSLFRCLEWGGMRCC